MGNAILAFRCVVGEENGHASAGAAASQKAPALYPGTAHSNAASSGHPSSSSSDMYASDGAAWDHLGGGGLVRDLPTAQLPN